MRIDPQPEQATETARPASAPTPDVGEPSRNGRKPNGHGGNGALRALSNGHGVAGNGVHELHLPLERVVLAQATLHQTALEWDHRLPEAATTLRWQAGQAVKRALDFTLALLGLVALAPLLLVVAAVVRLTSPGPVLYVCDYVGFRGRRFRGYKFRTMVADAESRKGELLHLNHMRGPAFKIRDDPRVTPVGRFLRKYSIDELPQLWNVVRGDMSLVGPRPPLPEEWDYFEDWQRSKLAVTPGITCTWQVNGRSEIKDFDEWARLDLAYIQGWSLVEDFRILLRTIPAVFKGHGAY